eukprot:CAMPEP_0195521054 /NCGR_PEP_ID=MMETSP0794_2-20130614/17854_1 /TAXON_ID=515487 /ORGANISM="Stephanopyxis turris, Strain CCMP 815" /LENGTH=468 /DNA_ID=CAMNT_0040650515 /DNA_START=239 /DNA_END=1645 /DNA_ORIENTATION=-
MIHQESSWTTHSYVERILYPSSSSHHKDLFPLSTQDKYGFLFSILGLVIAAGGGIGGGGILVPIYILVMGFAPKHAIPLSNITVFGGAVANTLLNAPKRHPHADRPLVDWDLILVMEPLTIGGALIGAFLNKLLSEIVLVVMLVLLLSFTAYNTLKKAFKLYAKESRLLREQGKLENDGRSELSKMVEDELIHDEGELGESLLDNMEENAEEVEMVKKQSEEPEVFINQDLKLILDEEKKMPIDNIKMLVTLFIIVLIINLAKGGGAFPSPLGIKCGSISFWISNAIMLCAVIVISIMARNYLLGRYYEKERVHYQYVEGDIQWDERATILYPTVCCFAGFFAGMFGVGGGIVKGPLMLAMGVHPMVSSATSACMILFTSFTATTSFVVFGLLIMDYGVVCMLVGFVSTLIGQIILNRLMKKYQRNSYIAFSIGAIVLFSAFLMTVQSLVSIAEGRGGASSGGICGKH